MECNTSFYALIAAFMSAAAAALSAVTAVRNYKLARSIQSDAKADERVVIGKVAHPSLNTRAHADAVLQIPIFNKSKRKAVISDVTVYDEKSQPVEVTWSGSIDAVGDPGVGVSILGINDTETVYVRRSDGKSFEYARVLFADSFSQAKNVVVFDPVAEFVGGHK